MIFHGIPDCKETSVQTESKVVAMLSSCTYECFNTNSIGRAHGLGSYSQSRCRLLTAKFNNYKARENFSLRTQLKYQEITTSEDFSPSTRLARKKLLEFSRSQTGSPTFKLKYEQLHMKKKLYAYDTLTGMIEEVDDKPQFSMANDSAENTSAKSGRPSS